MEMEDKLARLRAELLEHDLRFIAMLSERHKIVAAIGTLKAIDGTPVLQSDAFHKMQEKRIAFAREKGISEELINQLYDLIHQDSIDQQQNQQ